MIKGVLLDLSGVLYIDKAPLAGALDALKLLQSSTLPVCFITNTSRQSRQSIFNLLGSMGFDIPIKDIFTTSTATLSYLESHQLRPHLLIHPGLVSEFAHLTTDNPNAVVLGDAGNDFSYDALNSAFRVLMQGDQISFISMGYNRYFMESDGLSLDLGAFTCALEFASGKKAIITGKPSKDFFLQAVQQLQCNAHEVVMVGDDVESDIEGAMQAGLMGCLVKTGKYRDDDENRISKPPTHVADNFICATQWILQNSK